MEMSQHENYGGDEECQCSGHRHGNHDERGYWCCKCADEQDAELREFGRLYVRGGKLTDSVYRTYSDKEKAQRVDDLRDSGRVR